LVQRDVDEGRRAMNFSEWTRPQEEADEAPKEVAEGSMPLRLYLLTHPAARLSPSEQDQLARGLRATVGTNGHREQPDRPNH
jgi:hypothetical protein